MPLCIINIAMNKIRFEMRNQLNRKKASQS
jgi:hypothetical protein